MTTDRKKPPLRSGGSAWGPRRVELGVSIKRLERLSGVHRSILSMVENGRMVPTGDEWNAVMRVLDDAAHPASSGLPLEPAAVTATPPGEQ